MTSLRAETWSFDSAGHSEVTARKAARLARAKRIIPGLQFLWLIWLLRDSDLLPLLRLGRDQPEKRPSFEFHPDRGSHFVPASPFGFCRADRLICFSGS